VSIARVLGSAVSCRYISSCLGVYRHLHRMSPCHGNMLVQCMLKCKVLKAKLGTSSNGK